MADASGPRTEMIRAYDPTDEDDLIRVWLASTISGQAFLPEEHWRGMEPVIRDELIPVAETWVVETDGVLIAFMSLLGNLIGGLFTHPDHQGGGHGRELVEHARRRFDPLFVEVFEANTRALGFYRSCGFVDHERRIDEDSGLTQLILRMESEDDRASRLPI
jgi:putative acetyltransferase